MEDKPLLFAAWGANLGGVCSSTVTRMRALRVLGIDSSIVFVRYGTGRATFNDFQTFVTSDRARFKTIVRSGGYRAVSVINTGFFLKTLVHSGYRGKVLFEIRGLAVRGLRVCSSLTPGSVHAVVVPSAYVAALVRRALQDKPVPIRVVPNAVDRSLFHPHGWLFEEPPGRPVILWVGRLDPNKNWRELLRVLCALLRTEQDVELWVAGDVRMSTEVRLFEQRVCTLGLEYRVRLLPSVPWLSMPGLYRTVARSGGCVLSTSRSEGLQNSLLEAMATGCPVVSSAVGGNRELVAEGKNGLLYPPGDADAAARAVSSVLTDGNLRKHLVTNALDGIAQRHDPLVHAQAFLEVLDLPPVRTLARPHRPRRRRR